MHYIDLDFIKQLEGYRLTTAEILYHLPDHPLLLQSYIWQDMDLSPDFPTLHRFLRFWSENLDGKLHSVKVANCEIITTNQFIYQPDYISIC